MESIYIIDVSHAIQEGGYGSVCAFYVFIYIGFASSAQAMSASTNMVEYTKHYGVLLLSTRRKFEFADYGGKDQAHAAATCFISEGKKLMEAYDRLRRKPEERTAWLASNFSKGVAHQKHRSLDIQHSALLRYLCQGEVQWLEAKVMLAGVRATPNLMMCKLMLVHDQEKNQWLASVEQNGSCTSEGFKNIKDAKRWLLQMGHASEAGPMTSHDRIYIYIYDRSHVYSFLACNPFYLMNLCRNS